MLPQAQRVTGPWSPFSVHLSIIHLLPLYLADLMPSCAASAPPYHPGTVDLDGRDSLEEPRGTRFIGVVGVAHASCPHAELLSSGQGRPWKPETLEGGDVWGKFQTSMFRAPRLAKAPSALSEAPTEQVLTKECDRSPA